MELTLNRLPESNGGIPGTITCNPPFSCSTLENPALCIPAGTYSLTVYDSPHAGHPVPLLQDVPDRDEIEIHCGNYPCDSKGCILVGSMVDTTGMLQDSRDTFDRLFPLIYSSVERGEPVTLQVLAAAS